MEKRTVTVKLYGLEFEVSGDWTPYTPERIRADPDDSWPAEGGCFDDYQITLGGADVGDILGEKVEEEIREAAEKAAREEE